MMRRNKKTKKKQSKLSFFLFTFADLAAFGGALVLLQHDVTVARTGTDLFLALDVAILELK